MDINLPLLLFLAVAYTGLVWLYDIIFLRKHRIAAIEKVDSDFSKLSDEEKASNEAYIKCYETAAREPANVEYSKSFFPVLLIVFVIRSFLIEPFQIPSESMVPTLEVGDFIVVNKFTYGIRLPIIRTKIFNINQPERGDVMVFFPPGEDRYFIKRVIGLPGDKISYQDKVLTVNNEVFDKAFIRQDFAHDSDSCDRAGGTSLLFHETIGGSEHLLRHCNLSSKNGDFTKIISEGHYFMMGDNRDNSSDSRVFGEVPEERIVGKAFAIWMHWKNKLKSLPSFARAGFI